MDNLEVSGLDAQGESMPQNNLPPGIIRQPSEEEFEISERTRFLLRELFEWGEQSGNTAWVLGEPLGYRP